MSAKRSVREEHVRCRLAVVRRFAPRYKAGETAEALSKEAGFSSVTLLRYLRIAGVAIRRRGFRKGTPNCKIRKILDHSELLRLFDRGDTLISIGAKLGITRERVRQIAINNGRSTRGHSRPNIGTVREAVLTGEIDLSHNKAGVKRWRRWRLEVERMVWARNRMDGWKVEAYQRGKYVGQFTVESHEFTTQKQ